MLKGGSAEDAGLDRHDDQHVSMSLMERPWVMAKLQ